MKQKKYLHRSRRYLEGKGIKLNLPCGELASQNPCKSQDTHPFAPPLPGTILENLAQKIGQGLLDAAKQQAEEILDFLKGKGFTDISVSFHTHSQDDESPLGRRHGLFLTIDARIPKDHHQ